MNKNVQSKNRLESLLRLVPDIFDNKTILYIGASKLRFEFYEQLKKCKVDVVEIFEENVSHLLNLNLNNVYHCDIRKFETTNKYDYVIWHHGPEHVEQKEINGILNKLEKMCTKGVILGCPNGIYEQDVVYGNIYEKHLSYLYHEFFNELGYVTECLGEIDTIGSHITSFKKV